MAAFSILDGFKNTLNGIIPPGYEELITGQDLVIKFLSANDLPNMDLLSTTDPYFIAKIDDEITYISTILNDTLSPKWTDEVWIVRNVPTNATLTVTVYDKDDDSLNDDFIGEFEISDLFDYQPPVDGELIINTTGRYKGRFYLNIESTPISDESRKLPRYTFDGPCRYVRHDSPAMGHLTMLNTECIYSTWKITLRRIGVYLRPYDRQYWNRHYRIAQTIFNGSFRSIAKQRSIKLAHKLLYSRTVKNDGTGQITTAEDLWKLIFYDETTKRIRTRFFTYIIDDNNWRFSETGEGYFTDFASKHALHANCSEYVRYAGQFHPRPRLGWDRCDGEWELVFDNWSGTYAPSLKLLNNLKELLEFNFPGLHVVVHDFKDPLLKESMEKLKFTERSRKTSPSFKPLLLIPSLMNTKQSEESDKE